MDNAVDTPPEQAQSRKTVQFTYIDRTGGRHLVDAPIGDSLMKVATRNGIAGIDADCGGNCACGTCRVRITGAAALELAGPQREERGLLSFIGDEKHADCRLGCQVRVTSALAGSTVEVVPD